MFFSRQSACPSGGVNVVIAPFYLTKILHQKKLHFTSPTSHFTLNHFTLQSVALSFLPRMPWFCRGCRGSAVVVVVLPWMPPIHAAAGSSGQSEFPLHACHFILHTLHSKPLPTSERCNELSAEDVAVLPWLCCGCRGSAVDVARHTCHAAAGSSGRV